MASVINGDLDVQLVRIKLDESVTCTLTGKVNGHVLACLVFRSRE